MDSTPLVVVSDKWPPIDRHHGLQECDKYRVTMASPSTNWLIKDVDDIPGWWPPPSMWPRRAPARAHRHAKDISNATMEW